MLLIDIETDSADGVADIHAGNLVFYQDAGYFFVADIDVVGPFDRYIVGVAANKVEAAEGYHHGNGKLPGGF